MSVRVLVLGVTFCCFALILWSRYQHHSVRPSAPPTVPVANAASVPDAITSPLLNKPAPAFALRDLAGHRVSLADYSGKVVLINFWATWCAPCRLEMPWFIALQQKYSAQGFTILGIDSDYPEDIPKVPGFTKKMGLNYPVLYGNEQTQTRYDCCDYLPMSYYIDRAGTIRITTVGLGERNTIETYVRQLLESSPPPGPKAPHKSQIIASAVPTPAPR